MLSGRGVVSKPSVSAVIQEGVNLSCGLHCRLGMNGSNSCSLHSGILRFRQYPFPHMGRVLWVLVKAGEAGVLQA